MTRNNSNKTSKLKLVFTLLIISLLCFTLFFTACGTQNSTSSDTKYSYTETDDGTIKNTSFVYGTSGAKLSSYPKTSVTGWSLTKDSSAKSGVVDTSDDAWEKLTTTLYSDSGILNYLKAVKGFKDETDVRNAVKSEYNLESSPSSDEIKKYFNEKVFPTYFANPKTHSADVDSKIYMLNNYQTGWQGSGSVQKLTSATEITMEKGEYAKISVWALTQNISGISQNVGANIRITNSFNTTTQSPYGFFNINTNGEWKNYTFYVHADDVYETKFTLVLGLGYGEDYTEGTVYFDDITVELIESVDSALIDENAITLLDYKGEEDTLFAKTAIAGKYPLYDISLDASKITANGGADKYFNNLEIASHGYTSSTVNGLSGDRFDSSNAEVNNLSADELKGSNANSGKKISVKNASYTVTLKTVSIASESYAYVSFMLKNQLSDLYATTITANVYDINGATVEKRTSVATYSETSEDWIACGILVKNNFDRTEYTSTRDFQIELVIGPTDVKSASITDYAVGDVYITTPQLAVGQTYKYASDSDEENDIQTENYKYYQLFSSVANGTTSLYAGSDSDYTADETSSESYSITVAPGDIGTILTAPATPKSYKGIVANHYYIKEDSTIFEVDANENAGVINSKYLDDYVNKYSDIKNAFGTVGENNVQPLMIYNSESASYGYISENYTLSASSYAKVSVKVRVFDNAVAYIYLVDVSEKEKTVLTFADLKVNADTGYQTVAKDTEVKGSDYKFEFKVDSKMMDDDGWTTVEFYLASGATAKNFRVEMWNGSRDEASKSQGYAFFNDVTVSTSGAFSEPTRWQGAFTESGTPLYGNEFDEIIVYERELTNTEIKYNSEVADDKKVDYTANFVWAQNDKMIYAIYNTVDPVEVDPYEKAEDDTTEETETTTADPSTFWLSLSSILLGVALVAAIVMLIIKNIRRRRKANASDAKSHYKIVARSAKKKTEKKSNAKSIEEDTKVQEESEVVDEQIAEDTVEEQPEEVSEEETQSLDSYVYGEVQDFGENSDDNKNE